MRPPRGVLVDERNKWRKEIEGGNFTPHPLYEEYKANRDSELWRSTRQLEKIFEYIYYLEGHKFATEFLNRNSPSVLALIKQFSSISN